MNSLASDQSPPPLGAGIAPSSVLLIDDEVEFRRSTGALLRRAGLVCAEAADASEGLAHLEKATFDVLVADVNMPGNRDLELLRRCRDDYPDLPVILVTGYPSIGTAVGALRLAAVDYLVKPTGFDVLLARIDRAVARGHELRRARWLERRLPPVLATLERLGVPIDDSALEQVYQAGVPLLQGLEGQGARPSAVVRRAPDGPRDEAEPAASADDRGLLIDGVADPVLKAGLDTLSKRELEVLHAVLCGERPAVIARRLFISPTTVRNHLKAIFRKTGLHSQIDLVLRLRRPATAP